MDAQSPPAKPWYASKTVWVQALALVATVAQAQWGWVAPPEYEAAGLLVVNLILRAITRQPIAW